MVGGAGYREITSKKLKLGLAKYLWTRTGEPPLEYIELILCRDVYHCLPSQLYKEDYRVVAAHLALADEEAQIREARERHGR